jgi:hypothetical protein
VIDHNLKIVFVEIPKTATQTITKEFTDQRNPIGWSKAHMLYRQHYSISQLLEYDYLSTKQFDDYFKFSFIRNPFERAVSEYFYRCKIHKNYENEHPTFDHFIAQDLEYTQRQQSIHQHLLPNYDFIYMNDVCKMNFVGRYENLQNDYDTLCDMINKPKSKLKIKNSTYHNHYSEYYSEQTKKLLVSKYANDIQYLDYTF